MRAVLASEIVDDNRNSKPRGTVNIVVRSPCKRSALFEEAAVIVCMVSNYNVHLS